MNNPRTRLRRLAKEAVEAYGDDEERVMQVVMAQVIDDEHFVTFMLRSMVQPVVSNTINDLTGEKETRSPFHKVKDRTSPILPAIREGKDRIMLDMARMKKTELIPLAEQLERESDTAAEAAAFVRAVEEQLSEGETVGDRFTQQDLLRIKSRVSIIPERRYFLGQRQLDIRNGRELK